MSISHIQPHHPDLSKNSKMIDAISNKRIEYLYKILKTPINIKAESSYETNFIKKKLEECRDNYSTIYQEALIDYLSKKLKKNSQLSCPQPPHENLDWDFFQCVIQRCKGSAYGRYQDILYALQQTFTFFYYSLFDQSTIAPAVFFDKRVPASEVRIKSCDDTNFSVISISHTYLVPDPAALIILVLEVIGYQFFHIDNVITELKEKVREALSKIKNEFLTNYWIGHVDEIASDVLGSLSLGPAYALALLIFMRANSEKRLPSYQEEYPGDIDPHPLPRILKATIAAAVLNLDVFKKSFSEAGDWGASILSEILKDLPENYKINEQEIPFMQIMESIDIVAEVVADTPLDNFKQRRLSDFIIWSNNDAESSKYYEEILSAPEMPSPRYGTEANHVLSGALFAIKEKNTERILAQMINALSRLHRGNLKWFSQHPKDSLLRLST